MGAGGGGGGGGGGGAGGVGAGSVSAPSAGAGGVVAGGFGASFPGRSRSPGGYNTSRKAAMGNAMPIRSLIDPILSYVQATRGQL